MLLTGRLNGPALGEVGVTSRQTPAPPLAPTSTVATPGVKTSCSGRGCLSVPSVPRAVEVDGRGLDDGAGIVGKDAAAAVAIVVSPTGLVIGPVRWMSPPARLVLLTSTSPPPGAVLVM